MIINSLIENEHKAYVVGGCVRDSIMGREPHDWDICTSASTNEIMSVFKDYEIIPTGLKHGTVTIIVGQESYEITTFRIDGDYLDNRRPSEVIFTDSIEEDLKRRDFTINAMAYNDVEGLLDPFNGKADIERKLIKCVGKAEDRFNEDALRILRALRFASQLGFDIEENTSKAMKSLKENLRNISVERINSELCKAIKGTRFSAIISEYREILVEFIPEFKDTIGFNQNNPYHAYDVFEHTVHALENCPNELVTSLAVLFHDIGKPHCYTDGEDGYRHFKGHGKVSAEITKNILERLRFDNRTCEEVVQLVYYHDATFEVGTKYVKRWLNKIGEEQFHRLLNIRIADIMGQSDAWKTNPERIDKVHNMRKAFSSVLMEGSCFTLKKLAINGNDLILLGYKQGKELGDMLNSLLQKIIDEELENDRDELLDYVRRNGKV